MTLPFPGQTSEIFQTSQKWSKMSSSEAHAPQKDMPRGRRQGAEPFNPGAGPGPQPVSLPEAYTAAPPAADPPRTYPRSTIIVVIYSVFCVWCSKNIVFYRVSWPSPSPEFILATLKNHGFFHGFGSSDGVRNGKLAIFTALVST